ncbi:MAG: efflux RND transporter periplasmic adaptor subunit [Bacteroidaceae bacterium]|nr:efflux RND transporter periplasmic adaptor subunit [Bacteroidaceae bacterium]MDO4995013.1 efflux RND transporter periplasmic adaptor subunit [Bacteroidales bacterium]
MKKNISLYFVLCTLYFLTVACSNSPKVTYTTEAARKQNITSSITATGTIEPVTEVEVGTQVSGIIAHIYVDYNSVVHRGDVIAELDKTNLLSELASAQSNLANAQANLSYQSANYQRFKTLYDKGLISANEYEQARLTYEQARQQIVVQQQNVQKAKTNLGYATITAPIDGVVLAKKVEEGQTVASAMTTPTLFIIAQDLTDMRVIADIDEADIGGVKEGQRVTFTVDAYPEDVFNGNVTQVRQQATTESNVVTYEVVISARNDDLKLKPGLTANVTIYTAEKNDVLAVPSKALRFQPTEAMLAEDETIENVDAPQKVWKQDGKVFRAIAVQTGMTNGTLTEITAGLKEGDEVITEFQIVGGEEEAGPQQQNNPFMPGPRNRNQNQQQKK